MAITEAFSGTETIGTTEWSLTTDTAGPDVQTDDGVYSVFLELHNLALGDTFELVAYEKVLSTSTQRKTWSATFSNAQVEPNWPSPSLTLLHGWDFTLKKISGTDREINWSIRRIA